MASYLQMPSELRMPDVFGHDSNLKWSERQDFHLMAVRKDPRGPKLLAHRRVRSEDWATLVENGGSEGTRTLNPSADNGALC